jgi:hypothetical protein
MTTAYADVYPHSLAAIACPSLKPWLRIIGSQTDDSLITADFLLDGGCHSLCEVPDDLAQMAKG